MQQRRFILPMHCNLYFTCSHTRLFSFLLHLSHFAVTYSHAVSLLLVMIICFAFVLLPILFECFNCQLRTHAYICLWCIYWEKILNEKEIMQDIKLLLLWVRFCFCNRSNIYGACVCKGNRICKRKHLYNYKILCFG